MKTLKLSRELTPAENIEDINKHFADHDGYPICMTLTGLFAFTNREPYLTTNATFNRPYRTIDIGDKLVKAISLWCNTGKGDAIIHGRSYPASNSTTTQSERMPFKVENQLYFYHLGKFGQTMMWNIISSARRAKMRTNSRIYDAYRKSVIIDENIDDFDRLHAMDGNDEILRRSWGTFLWRDGEIIQRDTYHNDIDENITEYCIIDRDGKQHTDSGNDAGAVVSTFVEIAQLNQARRDEEPLKGYVDYDPTAEPTNGPNNWTRGA